MKIKYKIAIKVIPGCLMSILSLSDDRGTAATWKVCYLPRRCARTIKRRGLGEKIEETVLSHDIFAQAEFFIDMLKSNNNSISL